jgi:hypothetical protein
MERRVSHGFEFVAISIDTIRDVRCRLALQRAVNEEWR